MKDSIAPNGHGIDDKAKTIEEKRLTFSMFQIHNLRKLGGIRNK